LSTFDVFALDAMRGGRSSENVVCDESAADTAPTSWVAAQLGGVALGDGFLCGALALAQLRADYA
jgi:hypothetical protein